MHYEITITAVEEVETEGQSWNKVADSGSSYDGGSVYAYVPVTEKKRIRREVLKQEVETIDLKAVIKTINDIA